MLTTKYFRRVILITRTFSVLAYFDEIRVDYIYRVSFEMKKYHTREYIAREQVQSEEAVNKGLYNEE